MKVFGYARISVDIEQDRDNTSIENQKQIISDYVAENFWGADLEIYADRDRSGYTFEQREEYQKMRRAMLSSETKILVVKDFSRFSRRNSLGLLELETLRDAGVRMISINDGIDYPTKDDWMLIQFKFLMNEMPVTDTSKKIKAIINSRQKNGKWVCAVPYGYRLINTKEMTYEIDPPAAEVVRTIFDLYNSGWGYKKISNHLTEQGIPTPRANEIAWRESRGQSSKLSAKTAWSIVSVSGILSNDFYIGTLRQKKSMRNKINGVSKRVEDEEQIVIENAHPPIIDTKTFLYTQEQLKLRTKNNYRGEKKYATDYSGYLFCGNCGSPMFSMSRPDLQPAYICGTYHRRGRAGCSSHHIRVDKLDELLKRYVEVVRDNSADMMERLEQALKQQPDREKEIGLAIDRLEKQLSDAKDQLKALYKRKLIDTMGKSPDETAIIEEAYQDLEKDLTQRIKGLENQIAQGIDSRNQLLRANRAAKTVIDVFNDILAKPKLDKRDIGLIVEHITVYENPGDEKDSQIEIQLKADIDGLLATGKWEDSVNFPQDSKDISNFKIVQSAAKQRDKVFTVNVISNGEPMEIFTDGGGSVIFKKYSPAAEQGLMAEQLCESVYRAAGRAIAICDRDGVVAVSGGFRKALEGKPLVSSLDAIMQTRKMRESTEGIPLSATAPDITAALVVPVIAGGDLCGCVAALHNGVPLEESDRKLTQAVAMFFARQMEE